ncbi:MAG TPA: hypothetical protein PLI09_07890 [Candidatus Hydrogenedentes bacterium]|nr:hypothetical protein [Candidatus Hydrogenedentota bacterium]
MLRNAKELLGYRVHTYDGLFGRIHDLYFDDQTWKVRYLVADTSSFLTHGARVLITPHYLGTPGVRTRMLWVSLTSKQLCQFPLASSDCPVSFREEAKLRYRYFLVPCGEPVMGLPVQNVGWAVEDRSRESGADDKGDPHLRSYSVVRRYRVMANDGRMGYACDFTLDDTDWSLRQVVIETGHWPRRISVSCPVSCIRSIVWRESAILLSCTRRTLFPDAVSSGRKIPDNEKDTRIATLS